MSLAAEVGTTRRAQPARPKKRPTQSKPVGLIATALGCAGLIAWGFLQRNHSDLTAEEGLGYNLGIAGLSMMALLLTYSLRKRMPKLLGAISIRRWFEIHMMLGLAGPTAILFHCNFHLGSLNSTVSLVSMVIVALSGIAGRFMYTKIHHGLLGDRATIGELHEAIRRQRTSLSSLDSYTPAADEVLANYEAWALAPRRNAFTSTARFLTLGIRTSTAAFACRRASQKTAAGTRELRSALRTYLGSVRRAATFSTYAWLFSLWHALHLPLCVLLFIAAGIHVLAVHMY